MDTDWENEVVLRMEIDRLVCVDVGLVLAPKYIDGCDGGISDDL